MSSLAAARADNFYYPPEYKPEHGSLNKFRGSHPLGVRAKRIHEGVLVIRFEMPFKVFCTECHEVIAKGVRFNAEKRCVGQYFSTKILEFSMKCCFCPNIFRIQTDPKNCEYKIIAGLHKKVETFSAEDAGTVEFCSEEERLARGQDPMLKLEAELCDRVKGQSIQSDLEELLRIQEDKCGDTNDYLNNALLRQNLRQAKAEEAEREKDQRHRNFTMPLLTSGVESEAVMARTITFVARKSRMTRKIQEVVAESSCLFPHRSKKRMLSKLLSHVAPEVSESARRVASRSKMKKKDMEERLLPVPDQPALSLVVRPPAKKRKEATESPALGRPPLEARYRGELERIRIVQRDARKASALESRRVEQQWYKAA